MTTRGEDIFGYVVAVVRTSTDGQARLGTIRAQKAELPKTASRMGFDIKEWIEDDGASGRRIDGRNLKTLLGRIEAGGTRVTAILAVDLDRLMRPDPALLESMRDWAYLSWVLDTRDVRVIDAQGNVVRVGSVEERFRSTMATEEFRKIRARTQAGRRVAASLNRPASGFRPYGYRWVKVEDHRRGHWVVDDEHAAVVVFMFESYVAGIGAPTIARMLNERGVPTPKAQREANKAAKGQRRHTGPTRWQAGTILPLMKSRAYIGRWSQTIGGETCHGARS